LLKKAEKESGMYKQYRTYDKTKDSKRVQELKLENHKLKLIGDSLPVASSQLLTIFGQPKGYFAHPSSKTIYMIRNVETGKMYIGQTENIEMRKSKHSTDLNQLKHENSDMQLEYILYGSHSFVFEIIEFLGEETSTLEREKFWIKYFNTEWPNGYNHPYETNPEYSKRLSKKLIEGIVKIKETNFVNNLGKTKNYNLFVDIINKYKKENKNLHFTIWKTR